MKKEYYDWPWEHMDTIPVDRKLNTLLRLNPEFPLAVSHDDLAKYKIDLDELCAHVNLSRSACCRYFKKMMNMSISDYILEYRMSQALFMLGNSDKSITEIAFQSGFSSTSYFITRFREKMGMTPLEYKRKES